MSWISSRSGALLLVFLLLSPATAARPVVVPGPVCAVEDGNVFAAPDEFETAGAYFAPSCEPLILPSDVLFDFNKFDLKPQARPVLEKTKKWLEENPGNYYVDGHTDAIGSDDYNFRLGLRRAESVRNELVKLGISPTRLVPRSFGESRPVSTNENDFGRQLNRRVEVLQADESGFAGPIGAREWNRP